MTEPRNTRVRFAPSPTGFLHVGGLRTALYNYLFARRSGGSFILRIEDTDRSRYVEGAVEKLIDTLAWAGLSYDEGPGKGGAFGPYVQSERLALYRTQVEALLSRGHAYRCFCTPERLDRMRKEQERMKIPPRYDGLCRNLDAATVNDNLARGLSFVVRMRIPASDTIPVSDAIRGMVEFASEGIDDQVLLKSDGFPTYHLANVVDDHFMEITHVIRGEEWLPSTPKHVLLYRYFEWKAPAFAHLPLLLNPDRSKLSKRQGDVAVEEYEQKGYLPEALVNFVAFLGWNPGDQQELFSLDELVHAFSIDRVGKAGAIFNAEKLEWMNAQHLRRKADSEVLRLLKKELLRSGTDPATFSDTYLLQVIRAMRDRVTFVKDFVGKSPYFFGPPAAYDPEAVKKRWKQGTPRQLEALAREFSLLERPDAEGFEQALRRVAGAMHAGDGEVIHALRLALSGVSGGPGVFEIASILGRDESIRRIRSALISIPAPEQA